jgi:hypothetical protein
VETSISGLITGTLPRFVLAWLFPAMIVVASSSAVLSRAADGAWVPANIRHHSEGTLLLGFLALSLVTAYLLGLLPSAFYRLVLGISFPRILREPLRKRQQRIRRYMRAAGINVSFLYHSD